MHELAITESVVETVTARTAGARVTRVVLEIGKLTAVAPDAVRFCFEVCAKGTPLEGAGLEIVELPGSARCADCGASSEVDSVLALCSCGSANLRILGGEELLIREVEVV